MAHRSLHQIQLTTLRCSGETRKSRASHARQVNKMKFLYGTQASGIEELPHSCHILINGWRCDTASRRCRQELRDKRLPRNFFGAERKHSPKQGGKLSRTVSDRATLCFAEVEAELKLIQSYMFIGVYTRTELKRELKRCVDLGKPWPFVLAVIPHSATKQKSCAPRIPFTLKGVFAWPSLAVPGRLVESPVTLDAAGYPIMTE